MKTVKLQITRTVTEEKEYKLPYFYKTEDTYVKMYSFPEGLLKQDEVHPEKWLKRYPFDKRMLAEGKEITKQEYTERLEDLMLAVMNEISALDEPSEEVKQELIMPTDVDVVVLQELIREECKPPKFEKDNFGELVRTDESN